VAEEAPAILGCERGQRPVHGLEERRELPGLPFSACPDELGTWLTTQMSHCPRSMLKIMNKSKTMFI
jgi:hypothetical protein